jgi:hypothetical protein
MTQTPERMSVEQPMVCSAAVLISSTRGSLVTVKRPNPRMTPPEVINPARAKRRNVRALFGEDE